MPAIALNMSIRGQLLSGVRFNPAYLFSSSEPGVWYDPSDLTTLFQDAAGTTPVTAAGQPVGLVLDKSKGLVLGPELVTNGDFSAGSTGWTVPAGWSISGGVVVATAASGSLRGGGVTPILGRGYRVEFDVVSYTSGTLYITVGGNFTGQVSLTGSGMSPGRKSIFVLSGSDAARGVEFYGGAVSATIDNISVRELAGNHATQSTAASRPTYGVVPATGRRNLLTFTEDLNNAVWLSTWTRQGGQPDPVGGNTAWLVSFTVGGQIMQRDLVAPATVLTLSCWIKPVSSSPSLMFFIRNGTTSTNVAQGTLDLNTLAFTVNLPGASGTVTVMNNGWVRLTLTATQGITVGNNIWAYFGSNGEPGLQYLLWRPQLEAGAVATSYQRVTTAFDVTEAGVPSLSYLSFDGIDDFLVTPTITPNTNKVQVFAGVRKLSDATTGLLVELSASADSNAGGFYLANLSSGAWQPQTGPIGARTYTPYFLGSAPRTSVLATVLDNAAIGAGEISLRENGQIRTGTAVVDGGGASGNYLAYPLYIGRRGGTTLPFNGNLYNLIVRFGLNLSTETLVSAETWVNSKTGAY